MATTLTPFLRLRLSDNLTADALYNLQQIDTLGSTFVVNTAEDLLLRSREQIFLEPRSPDLDGSGVDGLVTVQGSLKVEETLTLPNAALLHELRLLADINDPEASAYSALRANATLASNTTWTLPLADGTANQVLFTDGSGQLGWATVLTDALLENHVRIGDATNLAIPTDTSSAGDILADSATGLTYKAGSIVNEDIAAAAAIARTKIAVGTPNAIVVNDIGGNFSSIATLDVVRGGTGANNAADARANLGLAIGTDVQAWDADLDQLASLAPADDNLIVRDSGAWTSITPGALFTLLGLGTIATQDADSVIITGGTIDDTPIGSGTRSTMACTTLDVGGLLTVEDQIDVDIARALVIGASIGANNLTLGGASSTVVIPGDLQVNGTTTSLNTTDLEVEDQNIVVNKNGNQASADGLAGLTVEMSDQTDGSLLYNTTLISKWAIGSLGSEVEIADISSPQTISNKNILGARHLASDWTSNVSVVINHGWGTADIQVEVYDIDSGETILVDSITRTDTNNITITASTAPTGSGRRVLLKEVA